MFLFILALGLSGFFSFCSDAAAYYGEPSKCAGVFYGGGGNALGANFLFILAVIAWTAATCMVLFTAIKVTVGIRVDREMEVGAFLVAVVRCRRCCGDALSIVVADFRWCWGGVLR